MKRHAKVALTIAVACLTIGGSTALALNGHVPSPSNPLVSGLANPQALAVDESTGDVYVLDVGSSSVRRFDSSGAAAEFSALGSNTIDGAGGGDCAGTPADCDETPQGGFAFDAPSGAQIAIDRSGGVADGYLYVTNSLNAVVNVFDQTGAYKGHLPNTGGEPCGVAVDPFGGVYVANLATSRVYRYSPAADPVDASFEAQLQGLNSPCNLAVDGSGSVYVLPYGGGELRRYEAFQFGEAEPQPATIAPSATAVYHDPASGSLLVDEGGAIARLDTSGNLIERFGDAELSESMGVAIHGGSSRAYASESATGELFAFDAALLPDATTGEASAVIDTSATLNGSVDPAGGADADCQFEWGTDTSYGNSEPCSPTPPYSAFQEASAALSGLTPGTTYHFRIVGSNPAGSSPGQDRSFTTVDAPAIAKAWVEDVGTGDAMLRARIDPSGGGTSYRFEYVSAAEFEANGFDNATKTPDPDGDLGAGTDPIEVFRGISGLEPATAYRFRAVATNLAGTSEGEAVVFKTFALPSAEPDTCPNAAFRVGQAAHLPDCRAYEQVTPVDKNGSDVSPVASRTRASDTGDALQFMTLIGFGDVHGMAASTEYMSVRGDGGWATHGITPKQDASTADDQVRGFEPRYMGEFSSDLSKGVFMAKSPLTDAPNVKAVVNSYLRTDLRTPGPGTYELLSDATTPQTVSPSSVPQPFVAAASEDFTHVLFESTRNLTVDAVAAGFPTSNANPKLYEWVAGEPPTLRLAGQIPASGSECTGAACVAARSQAGQGARGEKYTSETISADGSRVLFTAPPFNGDRTAGTLYQRDDQGTFAAGDDATVQVNATEKTNGAGPGGSDGNGPQPAKFWSASSDGRYIFFVSPEALTDDAPESGAGTLYRFDADAPSGSRLTRLAPSVEGVLGASEDGAYVYFMSPVQLIAGGPTTDAVMRIFLWHAGTIQEVGAVPGTIDEFGHTLGILLWARPKWSRVTPDGRHMAFVTQGTDELLSLYGGTEYDHGDTCPSIDGITGKCEEVYVYDAEGATVSDPVTGTGTLECASCLPSGEKASIDAGFYPVGELASALEGGSRMTSHLHHALSADGRYVFFNTAERLVPRDSNGTYDAYQYDTVAGEPRLLSSGDDSSPSYFLEASADGSDVFFSTRERLVGWDVDGSYDLYDARSGGGLPEPPLPPPSCQGDACQPAPAALDEETPSSSVFSGPGNPKAVARKRCAKSKRRVNRGGKPRCVRKDSKRKRANTNRRASR